MFIHMLYESLELVAFKKVKFLWVEAIDIVKKGVFDIFVEEIGSLHIFLLIHLQGLQNILPLSQVYRFNYNRSIMAQVLNQLRRQMALRNLQMYVLPRTDEHQSEYLVPTDQRVQYISGFTGSNALTLISNEQACLWTDGRYLLQAEKQLREGWSLKKMLQGQQKWFEFLAQNSHKQIKVGFDPKLIVAQSALDRIKYFSPRSIQFTPVSQNLVDIIWQNRPSIVKPEIYVHEQWAGKTMSEKVNWVRANIRSKQGLSAIFNDLSQIAWILNLRSSEIPHNPFFKSILQITLEGGTLFLPKDHPSLNNNTVKQFLMSQNICLKKYQPTFSHKCLINKNQLNYHIYNQVADKNPIEWEGIGLYRSVRTEKEINGFKRCHIADGIALAKFWSWRSKQKQTDQYTCAQKIDYLRSCQMHNKGLSFDTISASGPNGAIIHYRPTLANSAKIDNTTVHLLDSGGQYLDGTTDVTRAFHFGAPSQEEKESFTRVLLGNLDIERLRWPANKLTGADIDVLARRHLWNVGKDYLHGTGHGVGYFGSVHESPVSISRLSKTKFQAGMIVTNEPGYYQSGKYGIRIQNMLVVREKDGFNYFQTLTLCPYDRNLIRKQLLTQKDIIHIDQYHRRVRSTLHPLLKDDQQTTHWLINATQPL